MYKCLKCRQVISTYFTSQNNNFISLSCKFMPAVCSWFGIYSLNCCIGWSRICWFYSAITFCTFIPLMNKKPLSVRQTVPTRSGVQTVIRSVQSAWTVACVMILMETVYVRQDSWGRAARQVGTSINEEREYWNLNKVVETKWRIFIESFSAFCSLQRRNVWQKLPTTM